MMIRCKSDKSQFGYIVTNFFKAGDRIQRITNGECKYLGNIIGSKHSQRSIKLMHSNRKRIGAQANINA
ncbi:hypothetical protein QVD17_07223 [Tagetes erecta]|uniref:Uncharacterized protein n=1 Tax=Tagetes erecta TaxID=13708 RepID=A0AAD8LHE7_TARER|nr:hypothetical protein QVD17_07223 [Tagetes erecta]